MELLYLWVERYRNIKNQEFNFSPDFQLHLILGDPNQLHVIKYDEQPKGFFNNKIANVTAIIGRNGAGKSNLIDLLRIILNDAIEGKLKFLILFRENSDTLNAFHSFNADMVKFTGFERWKINLPDLEPLFNLDLHIPNRVINNSALIYISTLSDFRQHPSSLDREINLSSDQLLEQDVTEMGNHTGTLLDLLRFKQVGRQVDFVTGPYKFDMPFPIPKYIRINIQFNITSSDVNNNRIYALLNAEWEENNSALSEKQNNKDQDATYYTYQKLRNNFTWAIFQIILHSNNNQADWTSHQADFFITQHKDQSFINKIRILLRNKELFPSSFHRIANSLLDNGLKMIAISLQDNHFTEDSFVIESILFNQIRQPYLDFVLNFSEAYFLNFNWVFISEYSHNPLNDEKVFTHNLSSGEIRFLDLFAKFNSSKAILDAQNKNKTKLEKINFIYLLIDEGEAGFHPQWQKEYLHTLIRQLPIVFDEFNIQIIITTHSPIIASDLPANNIIFLGKDESGYCVSDRLNKEETFGANIHSLYTEAFFLQKGLMGEFAKEKINKVISWLKSEVPGTVFKHKEEITQIDEDGVRYIISHIGEPVIRKKLQQLYQDRSRDTNQ